MGELHPVHASRHVHVSDDKVDIGIALQLFDGIVGVPGSNGPKPLVLKQTHETETDQRVILDDKYGV
jgi:hypothetical protein